MLKLRVSFEETKNFSFGRRISKYEEMYPDALTDYLADLPVRTLLPRIPLCRQEGTANSKQYRSL